MSRRAVAGNFFVSGAGRGVGILIGIVTLGLLTRHLGEEGYGAYMLAFVFLTTLSTLANFGFPVAQLHMMARGDIDESRVVGGLIGLRVAVGAVVLALAPALVLLFDYDASVVELVALGVVPFFFTYVSGALGPVFQKHLIMGRAAVAALVQRVLFLALVLLCFALGSDARGIMLALAVSSAVNFVVQVAFLRGVVSTRPRLEPAIWRTAWQTGWPVAILTALGLICMQGDMLLLGVYRGEAEAGIYGLPFRILLLIISVVPSLFMGIMLPQLTRTWHQNDREGFDGYMQTAFDFLVLALLPVLVVTDARAEQMLVFVSGRETFAEAGGVLRILTVAMSAMFLGLLYRHTGIAVERQRHLIAPSVVVSMITLGIYVVFIPEYGMWAAAWGRVVHACAGAAVTFGMVYPVIRSLPRLGTVLRGLVAAAAMLLVLRVLPETHAALDVTIGLAVYAAGLLLTRAVRPQDLREVLLTLRARPRGDGVSSP